MNTHIVSVLIANLYDEATFRSQLISQLLLGSSVTIVEKVSSDWCLVRGTDDYEGFIHHSSLQAIKDNLQLEQQFKMHYTVVGYVLPNSFIYSSLEKDEYYYPHNYEKIAIASTELTDIDYLKQFLNAPYLWGGKSIFGLDCSALSQSYYEFKSINIPRDSHQQSTMGFLVDNDFRLGDLAFFQEGERIDHVGIMLNEHEMIHSRTYVQINSFNDSKSDIFSDRLKNSFKFCRRYL